VDLSLIHLQNGNPELSSNHVPAVAVEHSKFDSCSIGVPNLAALRYGLLFCVLRIGEQLDGDE
jgi:hypothetical protein